MRETVVKTEEFKDSQLEELPQDWITTLGENCFSLHSGSIPLHLRDDAQGELLYLKVEDFNEPKNLYGIRQSASTFDRKLNLTFPAIF